MSQVEGNPVEKEESTPAKAVNWLQPDQFMKLYGWVEALLFAADQPLTMEDLQTILADFAEGLRVEHLQSVIREIRGSYNHPMRGFHLLEIADGWQFRTNLTFDTLLRKLFSHNPPRISQAALEVMSIVAYRQPITRVEVDVIRGVDSGGVTRNLIDRKLVQVVGRANTSGRPYLYGTTPQFCEYFGLKNLQDLPSFAELSSPLPERILLEAEMEQAAKDSGEESKDKKKRLTTKEKAKSKTQDLFKFMRSGPAQAMFDDSVPDDEEEQEEQEE